MIDEEDDEGEGTAKAVAVFKIGVGTGTHHEFLREFLLTEAQGLSGGFEMVGHTGAQFAFTGVFHVRKPLFR